MNERRLTLEEILEQDRMMIWYEDGWCAESEDETVEVHGHAKAIDAALAILSSLKMRITE